MVLFAFYRKRKHDGTAVLLLSKQQLVVIDVLMLSKIQLAIIVVVFGTSKRQLAIITALWLSSDSCQLINVPVLSKL
jgi:hypothetical protein